MIYSNTSKAGKDYLKIPLMPVVQKGQTFFVSSIPADVLVRTFTSHPLEYRINVDDQHTRMMNVAPDSETFNLESSLSAAKTELAAYDEERKNKIARLEVSQKEIGHQRTAEATRVSSIAKFLKDEEAALFPNTIILTADTLNDYITADSWENVSDDDILNNPTLPFLDENNTPTLYIPIEEKTLLVVDGQHRMLGIKQALEENTINSDYQVLVSLMLKQSRANIASLFYTINHEQKPVNKSVLYHLRAEFSYDLDETTFLHKLVCFLNETERSPLQNRVKMLGKIAKETPQAERVLMTISQAALIDSLTYTVKEKVTRSNLLPIFRYYYNAKEGTSILYYIAQYLKAASSLHKDWTNPQDSQLSKTMGICALMKVMCDVFATQFVRHQLAEYPENILKITTEMMIEDLDGLQDLPMEDFSGSSSGGGVNKLRDVILSRLAATQDSVAVIDAKKQLRHWLVEHL